MQTIDASEFRGKRIRLSAAVRVEGADGKPSKGQLWLRVDRPNRHIGFFDDMADRPVISSSWDEYDVVGNVDDDAVAISFGLEATGLVNVWVDKIQLSAIPHTKVINAPPRAVTARGMENLVSFAKLFGYVRYFHPSDEASSVNWSAIAVDGVRIIESAHTPEELAKRLSEIFRPVGSTVRVFAAGHTLSIPSVLKPSKNKSLRLIHWKYRGSPTSTSDPAYSSKRVTVSLENIPAEIPLPYQAPLVHLASGVSALVPLTLYVDEQDKLPHSDWKHTTKSPNRIPPWSAMDRSTRLAATIIAWNVFEHFYPYFDVIDADWPRELRRALAKAAEDSDERGFYETLGRLTVPLRDGHVQIFHPTSSGTFRAPLTLGYIENRIVITHVDDDSLEIKPGDVVTKIDGRASSSVLVEVESAISGAREDWVHLRALHKIMNGEENTDLSLEIEPRRGEPFTVGLKRTVDGRNVPTEYSPAQPVLFTASAT